MQYENVPRNMPSVHWVTRSRVKLIRMRGENWVDAKVSVINRIAKTIDTTVIIDVAISVRIVCAIVGSACEGNRTRGMKVSITGKRSSSDERSAPAAPRISAITKGLSRNPPRKAYNAAGGMDGR